MTAISSPIRIRYRAPDATSASRGVLVACPDARPPAYEAAAGLAERGRLDRFTTSFYHREHETLDRLMKQVAPATWGGVRNRLARRTHVRIPPERVESILSFDASLQLEARVGPRWPAARHSLARWRTRAFDRAVARSLEQSRPAAALIFSDVGSEFALPACRRLGVASILSMVHGDVREERALLAQEAELAPDFFPIYLSDGPVDRAEMDWLHQRRLQDLEWADRVLVPSEHIAGTLNANGVAADRIAVVPYAADTRRFRPDPCKRHTSSCTFLFAGGINQRKGIKYLLEAWRRIRRPNWRLQLLGALPSDPAPLAPYRDDFEWLGRVGHADVPEIMARADVFVFPSLFEGSAVVTYEALACGLPCVVTAESGAVARDGREGFLVPIRDIEALADRMARLGDDPELRAVQAIAARARAEQFDWPRYHEQVAAQVFVETFS